jgi:hypothetical protein
MKTEMASYISPNTPLATRLFFRSCVESSPNVVEPKPVTTSPEKKRQDGAHMQLHQLKRTLLQAVLEETCDAVLLKRLCGAANEAAELAWATSQPLLVLPCLFEELAQRVRTECRARSGWVPEELRTEAAAAADQYYLSTPWEHGRMWLNGPSTIEDAA